MRAFVWFIFITTALATILRLEELFTGTFPKEKKQETKTSYFRWTIFNLALAAWTGWLLFH